jgi:hypothetical protein
MCAYREIDLEFKEIRIGMCHQDGCVHSSVVCLVCWCAIVFNYFCHLKLC